MAEGWVRSFNAEKGYGFLTVQGYRDEDIRVGKEDVFVHYADIQTHGYKSLEAGEYVSFAIERNAKGVFIARHVTPLGGPPRQSVPDRHADGADRAPAWRSSRAGAAILLLVVLVIAVVVIVRP